VSVVIAPVVEGHFPSAAAFENAANSARKTPARRTRRAVKTLQLKKADCEPDFLFIMKVLVFGQIDRADQERA
jgi:uncharacterized protein (DUF169 family)